MNNRRFAAGVLLAVLTIAIPNVWAAHRTEAEQAIAAAKAAHEQAASVQAATPDTAALIEEAEGLLPMRQYTKAVEIAEKATMQDRFAYEQAAGGSKASNVGVDADAARQALAAAEAARKKAASVGGEWRDTAQMIKDADGLAKSGRYQDAIHLAKRAERQGILGYEQAMGEKNADFPSYVLAKP